MSPSKAEEAGVLDNGAPSTLPPAYEKAAEDVNLDAAFANLTLLDAPQKPTASRLLAHLQLLHAFQNLKLDVGYADGIFGIWDSRAGEPLHLPAHTGPIGNEGVPDEVKEKLKILSQIREKRWALFIARAVDRYEAWWKSLPHEPALTEVQMENPHDPAYAKFPEAGKAPYWNAGMLPPLDVLMVWHSHMLNPRDYLEDCIRSGKRGLWWHGMPWNLVHSSLDATGGYNPSEETKKSWTATTGRAWHNADDSMVKTLKCPTCNTMVSIPWTTSGSEEADRNPPSLVGNGYGDGELAYVCSGCATTISQKLLSVAEFVHDARELLTHDIPMPGTVIHPSTGKPESWESRSSPAYANLKQDPLTFPNRLVKQVLIFPIMELLRPPVDGQKTPDMEDVRVMIEGAMKDHKSLERMETKGGLRTRARLLPVARLVVRRMMSRYWMNMTPFALDLGGAVVRQGIFVQKMCELDWLHSPAARDTMERLNTKYGRFLAILALPGKNLAVPTLEVDLAWHTHQLSPSSYYSVTVAKTQKFVDHDDKIEEDKLDEAFRWTSKTYQEAFGEVYSECTCWYCESIRSSHISSVGKVLGISKQEKVANKFHDSGAALHCPPDKSAHISAHNSVPIRSDSTLETVDRARQAAHQRKLEEYYQKACKRAEKKGRKLPPRDQYYDHWGYNYYMYGPWMYPLWFTPGLYYGWGLGFYPVGIAGGGWASCAAGTCTAGVAGGSCGGGGSCGAGGCGAGGCGSAAGACGGGGGGCGGGGGGGGCGGGCGG